MTYCSPCRSPHLLLLGLALALLAGCSSSRPDQTTEPSSVEEDREPALFLLYHTPDAGLVLHDARRDSSQTLNTEIEHAGNAEVSPSGQYLAFEYAGADSSHLALFDLRSQTLHSIQAAEGEWTYSLAWHPTRDQLAFGLYQSTNEATRGPGAIRVATPGGETRDVGCSAAREVLQWLPDGSLATRDDENLYVVASDDCSTIASHDARRMYHLTYSPDGEQLAFIHRELNYDREAVEYVPDSSLVVSDARLKSRNTLFGDERRVRHLRWAPDGSELAFDVRSPDSEYRQVAIYNGDRTIYLTPPGQTSADQVHPRWSPSGTHLAFTQRGAGQATAAVRIEGQTRPLAPVSGSVWGWLNEQSVVVPGPDTLRIQTLNGETRYALPTPPTLIHVWSQGTT